VISTRSTALMGLAGLALVIGACGANVGPGASGTGPAPSGAAGDKIVIGASLTLTGIQAPFDEPGLRGGNLAVEELNKKGGILGKQV
jgi:ABC-type branched-subunit amino acid transport system substrate-binding protein